MIFIPFDITSVINYLSNLFAIDLSYISDFQSVCLTLLANAYFFGFWFFIIFFSLKGINWVYERLF